MLSIASGLVVVLGMALLLTGWRGRRVDQHPLCRKCRFDLSGTAAVPERCPECGRDLHRGRRRVRVGNRRRHKPAMHAGAVLLVAGLGVGGTLGYRDLRNLDWMRIKPVWVLKREAIQGTAAEKTAAHRELQRRVYRGEIAGEGLRGLVRFILDRQADRSIPWDNEWGELVRIAWSEETLTPEERLRFVQQAAILELEVPEAMRKGGRLPYSVPIVEVRAWRTASPVLYLTIRQESVRVGDAAYERPYTRWPTSLFTTVTNPGMPLGIRLEPEPGKRTVTVRCRLGIRVGAPYQSMPYFGPNEWPEQDLEWTVELTAPIVVVPGDELLVEPVEGAGVAARVRAAASIDAVRVIERGGRWYVEGDIAITNAPINLACRGVVRVNGKSIGYTLGHVPEGGTGKIPIGGSAEDLPPGTETVDVVLRPEIEHAETTFERGSRVLETEVVIEDVPVVWGADGGS